MSAPERMNIGIVGAAGRGGSFRAAIEANGGRIHPVCETPADRLDQCAERMGAIEKYVEQMLDDSNLDTVV